MPTDGCISVRVRVTLSLLQIKGLLKIIEWLIAASVSYKDVGGGATQRGLMRFKEALLLAEKQGESRR